METSDDDEISSLEVSFEITENYIGERIDKVLAELAGKNNPELSLTRSKLEKLIENGALEFQGSVLKNKSFKIERAGSAGLTLEDGSVQDLKGDPNVKFEVVFEDECLVVINKPAGLVIHPGDGGEVGTLAHGLVFHYGLRGVGHPKRPGIVHRLDKDTSGLLVVAKDQLTLNALVEEFKPPRRIHRTYFAFTRKPPSTRSLPSAGMISAPIIRDPRNPVRMAVSKDGRGSTTKYRVLEEYSEAMLVELELETGRTHQIRVHLENIGIPILGDQVYNRGSARLSRQVESSIPKRQALHAAKLSFEHPKNKTVMSFEAPLPIDLTELQSALRS